MSSFSWRYNPRKESKCPICGGKASHFAIATEAPHLGYCWNPPIQPLNGWKATRNPNVFINTDEAPQTYEPIEVEVGAELEIASPNLRDAVYKSLLDKLPLRGIHKKDIRKRGFTDKELNSIHLGTLNTTKRSGFTKEIADIFPKGTLDKVPGFYVAQNKSNPDKKYRTLWARNGLLIPSQDVDGNIVALQIRPSYAKDDQAKAKKKKKDLPKYVWLSSNHKEGGTPSGSPAGVLYPKGTNKHTEFKRVFYTEGFFKALAIRERWNEPVVWIAGIHQWSSALEPLCQLRTKQIVAVFDVDLHENRFVQGALLKSIISLGDMMDDVEVKAYIWDPSLGKGIDDAILQSDLTPSDLKAIDTDKILTSICPPGQLPNTKYLRINEAAAVEPPKAVRVPNREECWEATDKAMKEAFETLPRTVTLITSGTGFGKSTALTKHIKPRTLIVSRDYDTTGEQIRQLLLDAGITPQWIYGRQPERTEPGAPASKRERTRIANCKDLYRAIQAIKANHNACLDCSHCPRAMEDGSTYYSCGYRKHRDELKENIPEYGLAVPKVALQENILKKFDTIVFDDIPELLQHIADRKVLTVGDIATWQSNHFDEMPLEFRQFVSSLRNELSQCNHEPLAPSNLLRESAKCAYKALKRKKSPLPCEKPYVGQTGKSEYAKAWVKDLLKSFIDGMPVELVADQVTFWTGRPEILRIFQEKRVIILDATADITLYKSLFGKHLFYLLNVPDLPKNQPRVVQVPDIIGQKEQIQRIHSQIQNLRTRENAFIISRAGETTEKLDADGWLGRHERAMNDLQHYDAGILAGHYSLPPTEAKKMAQGIRAIARQLNIPDPDVPTIERDEKGRAWISYFDNSGRYKGLQRYCAINEDSLAQHIGSHFHTSAVLQAWGRNRGHKILYLIDGKPLYSSDPNQVIWVTIMTMRELALEPCETRGNHKKFKKANEVRSNQRRERVEAGIESHKEEVLLHQKVPSVRSLRKSLGVDDKLCKMEVAQEVRNRLRIILANFIEEKQTFTGLGLTVPHKGLNTLKGSVGYTPIQTSNIPEVKQKDDIEGHHYSHYQSEVSNQLSFKGSHINDSPQKTTKRSVDSLTLMDSFVSNRIDMDGLNLNLDDPSDWCKNDNKKHPSIVLQPKELIDKKYLQDQVRPADTKHLTDLVNDPKDLCNQFSASQRLTSASDSSDSMFRNQSEYDDDDPVDTS
ncbi:MAG: hypothetical protein AAFQ83_22980 [Bacteroidota bacterium]